MHKIARFECVLRASHEDHALRRVVLKRIPTQLKVAWLRSHRSLQPNGHLGQQAHLLPIPKEHLPVRRATQCRKPVFILRVECTRHKLSRQILRLLLVVIRQNRLLLLCNKLKHPAETFTTRHTALTDTNQVLFRTDAHMGDSLCHLST